MYDFSDIIDSILSEKHQDKISKEEAEYTESSPHEDKQCQNCTMFIEGGQCSLVKGDIDPEGWCKYWEPK